MFVTNKFLANVFVISGYGNRRVYGPPPGRRRGRGRRELRRCAEIHAEWDDIGRKHSIR
jgi:hypothetical protein